MQGRLTFGLLISSALVGAIAWGQTGQLPPSSYDELPAGQSRPTSGREAVLEEQLQRLKDAIAGMGPNHPQLAKAEQRVKQLESDLNALRTIPNPFTDLEQQGVEPQDIVERLSERELRVLIVRLAVDFKDLRQRVTDLERANAVGFDGRR